jgi:hypothetical protein
MILLSRENVWQSNKHLQTWIERRQCVRSAAINKNINQSFGFLKGRSRRAFWRPPPSYINPIHHCSDVPFPADCIEGSASVIM